LNTRKSLLLQHDLQVLFNGAAKLLLLKVKAVQYELEAKQRVRDSFIFDYCLEIVWSTQGVWLFNFCFEIVNDTASNSAKAHPKTCSYVCTYG